MMRQFRVLIIGDSRVLPRAWEGKKTDISQHLKYCIEKTCGQNDASLMMRTIAKPNMLLREMSQKYCEVENFMPDLIILKLNVCEFIPRLLPYNMFQRLERLCLTNPNVGQGIRRFLARHRRILHFLVGKNSWSTEKRFAEEYSEMIIELKKWSNNILCLGCIKTSEESEHVRPGFQADVVKYNQILESVADSLDIQYVDLNKYIEHETYANISTDGIHYTDYGDKVVCRQIYSEFIKNRTEGILLEGYSVYAPRKPNYIQMELTNVCNVQCQMCELTTSKRKKGFMEERTFKIAIGQLVDWDIKMVRFTLWGEALVHPKVFEFIEYAKNMNLNVGLNTNGIMLNDSRINALIDSGIDEIIFSVDSFDDDDVYHSFRPSSVSVIEINRAILELLKRRNQRNQNTPRINIQMIGSEINKHQHKAFMNYWSTLVDSCRITHMYSMEKLEDFNQKFVKESDYFFECKYPWTTMGIYHDGEVTMCCRDVDGVLSIGNVHSNTLEEIYYSDRITEMRKSLLSKNKGNISPFCMHCYKYKLIENNESK